MSSLVTSFIGFPQKTGNQEIVIAEMQSGTAQTLSGSTLIQFDNPVVDSHSQLTLGAEAKFTCKIPGFYLISFSLEINWGSINLAGAQLNVNNVTIKRSTRYASAVNAGGYNSCGGSFIYPLNIGDVVEVVGFDGGAASALSSITYGNYLHLVRMPIYSEKSAVKYVPGT